MIKYKLVISNSPIKTQIKNSFINQIIDIIDIRLMKN